MAQNPLIALDEAGTSVWLDYIRRKLVESGELQRLIDEDGLRGMTSNPTIFEKSIAGSTDYDVQIRDLVEQGKDPLEIFQIIATDDIRDACDTLRPTYDRLNRYDGYVSVEVSPAAAHSTEQTLREAHDLWKLVDRPNVMIKVPGTNEGLPAIEQLTGEGINVNITLLFNVDRYVEVAECFIRGLERRVDQGQAIDHIASVASFFVSRVDTAVDQQLEQKVTGLSVGLEKDRLKALQGKAAIANAKIAYDRFRKIFSGERWQRLSGSGAMVQRPLWASTSTKNPTYRDVMYVEELIGPDTVNTMPQATMNAFKDHGRVRTTLAEDLEGVQTVLSQLEEAGINMDAVTRQLQVDGVRLFAESFDELMSCIDSERTAITMGAERSESENLGSYQAIVEKQLQQLTSDQFVSRLWEKDGSLWSKEEPERQNIKQALGWLDIVHPMREHAGELEQFAQEIRSEGFEDVVVLGMGGSSLCPDVLAHTFQTRDGYPRLSILDTTHPDAIEALTSRLELERTLFVVSSKSGTTAEPLAFYHYFWGISKESGIQNPGRNFIAISDPGTPLEAEARQQGFRRVFPGAPDIGGRYSALSNFGMVPAALMGIDVTELLGRAEIMVHATQPCVGPSEDPGVRLGTIAGTLAKEGRDKLTFLVSREIQTVGSWLEQLIAESTGKSGTGILPVEGESLGSPDVYGDDRLFVCLRMRSSGDDHAERETTSEESRLRALEAAGHPVVVLEVGDNYDLGGEFFLWEVATATAGHVLGINAFNQPNVQESKDNTNRLLAQYEQTRSIPKPDIVLEENGLKLSGPREQTGNLGDYLAAYLGSNLKRDSYVALMAYVEPSASHYELLQRIRMEIRDHYKVATTLGYGPRFLHSTGQLHKGGPDEGVFIQFASQPARDVSIEGEQFSFGTLIACQSLGDFQALEKHGRPVVRIDLGTDVPRGLQAVLTALSGAAVG